MDATKYSSTTAGYNHNDMWPKIETLLADIQSLCDQLLSNYHCLSSQQVVALIEVIEIQNFLLQEMFAKIAPASQIAEKRK